MISTPLRCMAIGALLLISCLSFGQETTYYENDRVGFSLYLPDSWTAVDEGYEQVSFLSSEEMQNDETAPGAGLMIVAIPLEALGLSALQEAYEAATSEMHVSLDGEFGEMEDVEVAGLPAISQTITAAVEDIAGEVIGLIFEDTFYVVLAAVHPMELEEQYAPAFDSIVGSLQFYESVMTEDEWFDFEEYGDDGESYEGESYDGKSYDEEYYDSPSYDDESYEDWEGEGRQIDVYSSGELSLQAAIDQASYGDTVLLHDGTYTSDRSILVESKQGVTIRGDGEVWIICTDVYENVLTISYSESVKLAYVKARHEEWLTEYECHGAVVQIDESSDVTLYECELNGSGAIGVSVQFSGSVTVSACYIHSNSYAGVYLYDVATVKLFNNVIEYNRSFIDAYSVEQLEMEGNWISDNDEWFAR